MGRRRDAVDAGRVVVAAHVEHLQTFRDAADELDVMHLHYDALKADLEGQMRTGHPPRHPGRRAPVAPPGPSGNVRVDAQQGRDDRHRRWPATHWIDPTAFFSRGTSGQWRELLDKADLARYAARVRALASDDLIDWVHREAID